MDDCWFQIIINCDMNDINNILLTCSDLNLFRQNKYMWKILIERDFKISGTYMSDYQKQLDLKYFWKIYDKKYDSNLIHLSLNYNQITEIPSDWNPQINNLNLTHNPIPKEQIDNFKKRNPNIRIYFE